jgi:WD40-like Beta Propeller Repeat
MITTTMLTLTLTLTSFDSRALARDRPFDSRALARDRPFGSLTLAQDKQTLSAKTAQVSAPTPVSTIDTGKLKGEPTQLAWSPDGTQLFLQTSERDSAGMTKNPRFFVMSASDGKPAPVGAPPAWAAEYWTWKSNQFAPGSTTFGIQSKVEERKVTATATPMGGDLAKGGADPEGGGGTTAGDVAAARAQTHTANVFTLTLKGEVVGEFAGQQFLPGYTFGWSPKNQIMAYGNQAGRLALIDAQGGKQQIDATKNVILPAWSPDGTKIAFLQKAGKNKYDLVVVGLRP